MTRKPVVFSRIVALVGLCAVLVTGFAAKEANAAQGALAEPGRFGLGLGGSNLANGLTGKFYMSNSQALQASVGYWWSLGLSAAVDYLYEMPAFVDEEHFTLHWYLGVGGTVGAGVGSGVNLGAQAVAGLDFQIREVPLELALEIRPTFLPVGPRSGFHFGGGGAIRYYF